MSCDYEQADEIIRGEALTNIEAVAAGTCKSTYLPMLPLRDLCDMCRQAGFTVEVGECETNGWQIDFWQPLKIDDENYTLSGSLWSGDYQLYKD